jgi:predicted  nucleic acid-binding Zn-ribbon protein
MKYCKPNIYRHSVVALSATIVCAFALFGCAVVTTSKAPEGSIEGIVYHLPASFLKVSVESKKDAKGNHSELVVAAGAEIVPDTTARLVLGEPSGNGLFTRDHTFTLTNGLLSTIAINDEGKSGEIITDLAAIAMNIVKVGALPETKSAFRAATGEVEHESRTPSNKEIEAALSSIAPGRQDFLLSLTSKSEEIDLPGTATLLGFSVEIPGLPDARPTISKTDLNNYKGIATRVLEPYPVIIVLNLRLAVLYKNRIATFIQTIGDLNKTIEQATKEIADLSKKVPSGSTEAVDLKAKIAKAKKTLNESMQGKADATRRRLENEAFLQGTDANEVYGIANQSSLILIPDYSPIVKIPLSRSLLGRTKYSLTLNHGILTDYHAEHPSPILEIVKVPFSISEAIIKLPTEILQLKIDYSSKAQALAKQQTEYQETLKAMAEKKNGLSTYDEQVKALEQEKAILQLQKEITELKAAILELESQ